MTQGGSAEWGTNSSSGGRDRSQRCRKRKGRQLAETQTNQAFSFFLPRASLFCCCFASIQGCAMNWAAANSHQFVRSSLTVISEVWGRRGWGRSCWCQPPTSRVITGHWAVLSRGQGVKNTPSLFNGRRRIKICAEPNRRFVKFGDIVRDYGVSFTFDDRGNERGLNKNTFFFTIKKTVFISWKNWSDCV